MSSIRSLLVTGSMTLCFAEINIAQEVKGKPSGPSHHCGF